MLYEYVGLEHFREILTSDDVFWKAARNSLVWAVVAPLVDLPLAFVLALTLHARVPFARFFRTVWFTPVLMSVPGRRRDLAVGLQLRLGHRQPGPARRRPRRLRAGLAGQPGHRAARADPRDHVDVRGLQHGRAAGRDARHPRRLPRRGARGRRRVVATDAADHGAAAVADDHQPRHPRLHRQDEAVRAGLGHDARRPHVGHRDGSHLRGQARLRVEDARPRLSVRHRRHLVRHHLRPSLLLTRVLQRREALEF